MHKEIISKALLKKIGIVLALAGLAYLADAIVDRWGEVAPLIKDGHVWVSVGVGSLLWALAVVVLAYVWASTLIRLSHQEGEGRGSHSSLIGVYCLSNLSKYVPSNVMHFAARQFQAHSLGYSQRWIATATVIEALALLAGAFLIGAAPFILAGSAEQLLGLMPISNWSLLLIVGLVALAGCLFLVALRPSLTLKLIGNGLYAVAGTSVYFLSVGVTVTLIGLNIGLTPGQSILAGGVYILSWVFGYLLPGAAAGIGVREASFLLLGSSLLLQAAPVPESALLLIAFAARLTNLLGDGLNFCGALLLSRKP